GSREAVIPGDGVALESLRIERAGVGSIGIASLRVADEHALPGQRPVAGDDIGRGVATSRHHGQASVLDVGQNAVDNQIPLVGARWPRSSSPSNERTRYSGRA